MNHIDDASFSGHHRKLRDGLVIDKGQMMQIRLTCLAVLLVMTSTAAVFAQSNNPAGDGGVSPTTVPYPSNVPAVDRDPTAPGATGDARVLGDNSTMSGDKNATIEQRTGLTPSGNGGGDGGGE